MKNECFWALESTLNNDKVDIRFGVGHLEVAMCFHLKLHLLITIKGPLLEIQFIGLEVH